MHALKKNRPFRRIVLASAATVSGVVMLLTLKPHTAPESVSVTAPAPSSSSSGSGSGTVEGGKAVTGESVQTRWGPVQVRITVADGRITDVTAVTYPQENPRDQQINAYAIPRLRSEALTAQSADIDTVSGATYTSDGYRQSLQSALDSAGL
ncbi:FMN-binding protein [Streptomyces sp. NPDC049687]|uniref:FMN-binding protein n=1 Tax=Streptomyces sp. NPDC049687 TaxID=3365596 RepID=UPI0037B2F6F9